MINCDYESHHYLPLYLEKAQVKYPIRVLAGFFRMYDLPRARFYLWQLLKWYGREEGKEILLDHSECFSFYEEIICFMEAANLLLQKDEEKSGNEAQESPTINTMEKIIASDNEPEDQLNTVINIIKKSMDVEKIYLLGKFPLLPEGLGDEYDLLILVSEKANRPNDEFESLVQNRSADTVPVHTSVYKIGKVNEMIRSGHYFFSTFCIPENLIYDAGRIKLETPLPKHDLPRLKVLKLIHKDNIEKAHGFFLGATNYYAAKEYSLCGFMLHQVVEHGLNSLLQPLMQFRIHTHNLNKLMRTARRFSMEIFNLFPRDTDGEIKLFQILQKAYIHARYKDSFEVTEEEAGILLERIKDLLQKIEEEFDRICG